MRKEPDISSFTGVEYSIVLPIFNEQDSLEHLYENIRGAMQEVSEAYEVIMVDDGSTDGSRQVMESIQLKDKRFRGIYLERNYGQSSALVAGFRAAAGEVIIMMDADLQVDAHDIPKLIAELGTVDAVTGYRKHRSDTLSKRITSQVANRIRNWVTGETIRDIGCPLKAFRREVLEGVVCFDGMHRFLPTLIKLQGYTVSEVPITHHKRRYGKSKYTTWNRLGRTIWDLLGVRWLKKRRFHYRIKSIKE
jgi:dolichol-phosphate mannosyltransferase